MDADTLRPWLALVHVLGAFGFVLFHGASAVVSFRLRAEREPVHVRTLLELSSASQTGAYASLGVLLLGGITGGVVGGWWTSGRWWLWLSVGTLVAVMVAMTVTLAAHFNALRHAVGLPTYDDIRNHREGPAETDEVELARLLRSPRPLVGATIGIGGIGLITTLMMLKPI